MSRRWPRSSRRLLALALVLAACSSETSGPLFCEGIPEFDIYVTDLAGNVSALVESPGADGHAKWSPDGSRIAFVSSRDGNCDVYVMNSDGTDLNNVTNTSANELYPSWSPDGTHLVYASDESGRADLFILDLSSGERQGLVDTGLHHNYPAWSPDGRVIAFSGGTQPAGADVVHDIYTIDVLDGSVKEVTLQGELLLAPVWQKSGAKLSYLDRDGPLTIWVTNPDGVGGEEFLDGGFHSWSPDDGQLVFDREVDDGDVDIYVVNADGSGERLLVDSDGIDSLPDWSPSGHVIVFSSDR